MKVVTNNFAELCQVLIQNPKATVYSRDGKICVCTGWDKLAYKCQELRKLLMSDLTASQFKNKRRVEVVELLHKERMLALNTIKATGITHDNCPWFNFGGHKGTGVFDRVRNASYVAIHLVTKANPGKEVSDKDVIKACAGLIQLERDYYFVKGDTFSYDHFHVSSQANVSTQGN
jgi:hypothetical protein